MNMEHLVEWRLARGTEVLEESLPRCQFVHNKLFVKIQEEYLYLFTWLVCAVSVIVENVQVRTMTDELCVRKNW
jgi:hypothetical protein